jgi:dTMP kinase
MAGVFITLEGGDGSGKSTQAELLTTYLTDNKHTVIRTREPGGTELGARLREIVLHSSAYVAPRAEALLYAADRAQNIAEIVRPALERGDVVIQDRYVDSSLAYQGAGRELDPVQVLRFSMWAASDLMPNLTILLDIDPTIGRERRRIETGSFDRLEAEQLDFHARVRAEYLAIAERESERFLVLDATRPIDELAASIRSRVVALLP